MEEERRDWTSGNGGPAEGEEEKKQAFIFLKVQTHKIHQDEL